MKPPRSAFSTARGTRAVLAVLLLVALVPAFLLQVFLHIQRFRAAYQDERYINLELAHSVASMFEAHLDMAADQANVAGEALLSLQPFDPRRAGAYLAERIGSFPALSKLHWADLGGRIIASSDPEAVGGTVAGQEYFRRALRQREWVLSDLIPAATGAGLPSLVMGRAMSDWSRVRGVLIATVQPAYLAPHPLIHPVSADGWVVIDRQGMLVFAQPDPAGLPWRKRDLGDDPLVAAALRGEQATGVVRSSDTGEERLVAMIPLGERGWAAGAGRSRRTVLAPLWRDLALSTTLSLAVALLSGLLALRLARQVVRDIGRLKSYAAALGRGQVPPAPAPMESLAELQSLAESFHRMAVHRAEAEERLRLSEMHLRELNLNLERIVQERTEEIRQQADRLRALASELTRAEQRERRRLAGVLHDHLQQLLVAARMQLGLPLREARSESGREALLLSDRLLDDSIQACRSLTVELCPPVLYNAGLPAAFQWLAERLAEQNRFSVELHIDPDAVPQAQELCDFVFQAVRELLFNAVKHSGVNRARLITRREGGNGMKVIVEDEGKGLDPRVFQPERPAAGKFGLFSIRQRLENFGGTMEVADAAGRGTRVTLRMPLEQTEAARPSVMVETQPSE